MPPKRACDICYKRKIQCIRPNPDLPCDWCSHHDLECVINREAQSNKNHISGILNELQALTRRVTELEDSLSQIKSTQKSPTRALSSFSGSTTSPENPGSSVPATSVPTNYTPGLPETDASSYISPQLVPVHGQKLGEERYREPWRYLGRHWYFKGMPILSEKGYEWMASRTGEKVSLNRYQLFGSQPGMSYSTPAVRKYPQQVFDLPDRTVTEAVLDVFFCSPWRSMYPVIDPVLMEETVKQAYQSSANVQRSHMQRSSQVCVVAALAMISQFEVSTDCWNGWQGDFFANSIQAQFMQDTGELALENLQTVLMLQIYRMLSGHWDDAAVLNSLACHIVCALQGHHYRPPQLPSSFSRDRRLDEHVRRLFWMGYIFDKDMAIRNGQPPKLTKDYCDLTLPSGWSKIYDVVTLSNESSRKERNTEGEFVACFSEDLYLARIKEKICLFLGSPHTLKLSDTEILYYVRELDFDLESWRSDIPNNYRPTLSCSADQTTLQAHMTHAQRMRRIHLQLEYHYLTTVIQTAVRRCGAAYAEAGDLPDDLHSVYHSSSDLSLEASRSTLKLLKNHESLLEEDLFGHIAYYLPIAAMSLFLNILIHPQDSRVLADLQILASSVTIFQKTTPTDLIDTTINYIREANRFVSELVHLGNCAIWKAKREARDSSAHSPMDF